MTKDDVLYSGKFTKLAAMSKLPVNRIAVVITDTARRCEHLLVVDEDRLMEMAPEDQNILFQDVLADFHVTMTPGEYQVKIGF